jgi:hypothetical protein
MPAVAIPLIILLGIGVIGILDVVFFDGQIGVVVSRIIN